MGVKRGLFISLLVGCSVFDPSLVEVDAGTDSGIDTGTDSGDSGTDAGPGELRHRPERPPASTEGPDVEALTVALRDVVLNQGGEQWRTIGLDLDGLHTTREEPSVECVPPAEDAMPPLDGDFGIDNVFGASLYPLVQLAIPNLESDSREAQLNGLGTLVIRVFGWNGTPNDPRVDVLLTQAAGGTSAADVTGFTFDEFILTEDGSAPAPPPTWEDGQEDVYFGRDDTYLMGNESQPLVRDDNGYVRDGTIVMRLPDRIDILFFAGDAQGVRVRLTDGTAMATLDEELGFSIATVIGRWGINDLLETGNNIGICVGTEQRALVDRQLQRIADVRSRPGTGGEGVICDALSLGVTFVGKKARWAGLGPSRPLPDPCTPD